MLGIILGTTIPLLLIFIALVIFFVLKNKKNKKKKQIENQIETEIKEVTSSLKDKFGGKDNIESIDQKGSRVSVVVKDISLINKEEINNTFDNVMFMSNKIVFMVGSDSVKFKELLEENISK